MTDERQAVKILADNLVKAMRSVNSASSQAMNGKSNPSTISASKIVGLPAAFASIISGVESGAAGGDAVAQQTLDALNHIAAGEFETITADTAMISKVYATYGDFITLVANNATIGDLDVAQIRAGLATVGLLNIGSASIDMAQIKRSSTQTAFIHESVQGKVYIDDLAVSDASIVNLAAGTVLINNSNNELVELYVDPVTGNVSTRAVSYDGSDIINQNSMNGNRIVQNSITTDRLNASEIFAANATVMNLIGDNIDASRISTGHLSANMIQGGTLTLGGQNNQNGTLSVRNASGNVIGSWDMDGINVTGGSIEIITSGGSVKLGNSNIPLSVQYEGYDSTMTEQRMYNMYVNDGLLSFQEFNSDSPSPVQYNKAEFSPNGLKFYQAASSGADPEIVLQDYNNQFWTSIQHGYIELIDLIGGGVTTLRYDGIQTPSLTLGTPLDIPNGGHGGTTAAQGRTNLSVYSKAEVDSLVGAKLYSVRGNIVKSASTGTAVGYGKAVVYIVGKTVVVEFEAKITTAGTLSGVYDIGIQVANLRTINSGIPAFTVSNGGIIHYYKDDGAMDTRLEGYAGEATLNTSENRWAFGRLYDTSGSIGAWADNNYSAGKIITGTLYGVLN